MRSNLFGIVLVLLASGLSSARAAEFAQYCNARFAYCVDYATSLRPQGEPENGDGQVFRSPPAARTELRVYGHYNVLEQTLAMVADETARELGSSGGRVTYRHLSGGELVLSGIRDRGATIYYTKVLLVDDRILTMVLTYPVSRRIELDPAVARMSRSFHALAPADADSTSGN